MIDFQPTPEARSYAVKELARRAGCSEAMIQGWRIETTPLETQIFVLPGTAKRICLPISPEASDGFASVHRPGWMRTPSGDMAENIPDFVVPHCALEHLFKTPTLFEAIDDEQVRCDCDLLRSVLVTLTRFEERVNNARDEHGRFFAKASMAWQHGFLDRPIVDEYGFAFAQALQHLLPSWEPAERVARVKLSHDIDLIGIPFSIRATLGHSLRRRRPWATGRDFVALASTADPAYLQLVRTLVNAAEQHQLRSAIYWQACGHGPYDVGYNIFNAKVHRVIEWLQSKGAELGIHPSYRSFGVRSRLRDEVSALERAMGAGPAGGRQHYLRWHPDSWADWEACGLSYDSTVGYADHVGFRAGTCYPYRPWLIAENREADLVEIPLLVMDETLIDYMHLDLDDAFRTADRILNRCKAVGGVFTLLWHNSSLLDPRYGQLYERVLELLSGSPTYSLT